MLKQLLDLFVGCVIGACVRVSAIGAGIGAVIGGAIDAIDNVNVINTICNCSLQWMLSDSYELSVVVVDTQKIVFFLEDKGQT